MKLFLLENLVNVQNKKVIFTLKRVKYKRLQEFQYGNNVFQATTNKREWFKSIYGVRFTKRAHVVEVGIYVCLAMAT